VDSAQLKKNIEELLEASRLRMTADSLAKVQRLEVQDSLAFAARDTTQSIPKKNPDPSKTNKAVSSPATTTKNNQ
jgi:hypothetical protein